MASPSPELIRGIPIFADLDDASVSQLASDFVEREFKPDAAIATEGEGGLNFFVVESGTAEVTVGGKQVGTLGPGVVLRRDRARRQVGPLGDRDRDLATPGLRASRVELPQLRRVADRTSPGSCSSCSPSDSAPPSRADSEDEGAAVGHRVGLRARRPLPRRRATRVGDARRPVRALRARDRHACLPASTHRRGRRVPGGVHARLRAPRHAPRRRRPPSLDRADDPAVLDRRAAPLGTRAHRWPTRPRESTRGSAQLDEALSVRAALEDLSPDCSEILDRFFCRDESYRTIGAELELPAGTIASRIARCLRRLRAHLEEGRNSTFSASGEKVDDRR